MEVPLTLPTKHMEVPRRVKLQRALFFCLLASGDPRLDIKILTLIYWHPTGDSVSTKNNCQL